MAKQKYEIGARAASCSIRANSRSICWPTAPLPAALPLVSVIRRVPMNAVENFLRIFHFDQPERVISKNPVQVIRYTGNMHEDI